HQGLLDALLRKEQLRIRHEKVNAGRTAFEVDPYTLLLYRKVPYLIAYSHHPAHKKKPLRSFAFDGIRSVKRMEGKASARPHDYRPDRFLKDAFRIMDGKPEMIR